MKKRLTILVSALLIAGILFGISYGQKASATVPGTNALVSANDSGNGQGGNGDSSDTSTYQTSSVTSADGKYVAFVSNANNLVSNDTNAATDVFVRNLSSGTITRVDVSSSGAQANAGILPGIDNSSVVAISRTGRYVAFVSAATNLISGQTISSVQVYLHDMQTSTTSLVPVTGGGTIASGASREVYGVSSDGRFVLFASDAANLGVTVPSGSYNLYRADMTTGTFQALNVPISGSYSNKGDVLDASMSCDGSMIVETEFQDSLTSDDTNSYENVYFDDFRNGLNLTDLTTAETSSSFEASISCSGDFITFESYSHVFTPTLVANDLTAHMYLYNRINSSYTLVDQSSGGTVGNHDVNGIASADDSGNVIFLSAATNLSSPATSTNQLWLHTYSSGTTELLSRSSSGTPANGIGLIGSPSISASGKIAAYFSSATNLISSDTNGKVDVFTSLTGL